MNRIPLVIDTDPGVDDFFCLALACTYDDVFDLKGVCSMGGNHYTDVTTQNALNILSLFRRDDVPVARGADRYLTEPFKEPAAKFHGENGLGNVTIPMSGRRADPLPAWEKLYEIAKACAGGLVLVTVAPLTNVAMALQRHPDLPRYLKKIVTMGGSTTVGNISPYAEANVGHDAPAAKIVFESGVPLDMVGLNVTKTCPIRPDVFTRCSPAPDGPIETVMQQLIAFRNGEAMHDAIAISTLIDEQMAVWDRGSIQVITDDPVHMGQTVLHPSQNGICRAASAVDHDRYDAVIGGMLRRLH